MSQTPEPLTAGVILGLGSPLRHLDISAVSAAATNEVGRRERHLPTVSVFRWWARRTSAVSGAVLDAVARDLGPRLRVADPFAGGGTVALQALLRGHWVHAQDIDPWAAEGIAAALSLPAPEAIHAAGDRLRSAVAGLLDRAYGTSFDGGASAWITHTLRVAVGTCPRCDNEARLFPYATLSRFQRVEAVGKDERAWLACRYGHVHGGVLNQLRSCPECSDRVDPAAVYTSGRQFACHACGQTATLALWARDGFRWEVVLVERADGVRREISIPRSDEIQRAESDWMPCRELPQIEAGRESTVLLRHGFRHWHDLYPRRQRVILEAVFAAIPEAAAGDPTLVRLLHIVVAGAAEMAGHMSRWDRRYLKAYEAMAGHRFNLTTLAAEPNVWGVGRRGRGSISLRIAAAKRAAEWLTASRSPIALAGPFSTSADRAAADAVDAVVVHGSSERMPLLDGSVDLIWTDPPYHDDVQYHDLSALFRVWLGLCSVDSEASAVASGPTDKRYVQVLRRVFAECRRVLAPHGRLLLTYANRDSTAWIALYEALRDAGFRAQGYEIVRSDAETDFTKRRGRTCSMDLVLDLVPAGNNSAQLIHRPACSPASGEGAFLAVRGEVALTAISDVPPVGWRERLRSEQTDHWSQKPR